MAKKSKRSERAARSARKRSRAGLLPESIVPSKRRTDERPSTARPRFALIGRLWRWFSGDDEPRIVRVLDRVLIFAGAAGVCVAAVTHIRDRTHSPQVLAVAFYSVDEDGQPSVSESDVVAPMSGELAEGDVLEVPLRLAVRNEGNEVAPVTKVVIRTRSDIDILPDGRSTRKVDPEELTLTYEREIRALHPEDDWTLYEEIDTLRLRAVVVPIPVVALSSDRVPFLSTTNYIGFVASNESGAFPTTPAAELVPLHVEFFSDEGLVASSRLVIEVPFTIDLKFQYDVAERVEAECSATVSSALEMYGNDSPMRQQVEQDFLGEGETIRYLEFDTGHVVRQVSELDGVARSAHLDTDLDGLIDLWIVDQRPGGRSCFGLNPPQPLEAWPVEAFAP